MKRPTRLFLIASLPAALISAYSIGIEIAATSWLPLLGVSLGVSRLWAEVFARWRGQPLDSGWIATAWLFSLLLPIDTPLGFAAVGLSFGLLFGCHVFGGTGRYLVNPALLGVVFLAISYPPPLAEVAMPETNVALGVASLAGAVLLIVTRAASVRVIGAAIAAIVIGALFGGEPWQSHLMSGSFAFVLAFVATDPTTRPATPTACWAFGALFGALTIVLRTLDPAEPEGSLSALLLASLCVPLLDHIARFLPSNALGQSRDGDA